MSEYFELAKSLNAVAMQELKNGQDIAEVKYKPILNVLLEFAKKHHEVCFDCEGTGKVYNNADPTSGQWVACPYAEAILKAEKL